MTPTIMHNEAEINTARRPQWSLMVQRGAHRKFVYLDDGGWNGEEGRGEGVRPVCLAVAVVSHEVLHALDASIVDGVVAIAEGADSG